MLIWSSITYLGDSAVTTPSAAILAIWLLLNGKKKAALQWILAFCFCMGLVVISKLAFMGWNITLPGLNFTGISGHSASAMSVLPVLVFLLVSGWSARWRFAAIALVFLVIGLVGISRVVLQAHSPSEVVLGLLLGACASLYFILRADIGPVFRIARPVLVLAVLLVAVFSAGRPAPTQQWLTRIAVALSGHAQPYVRTIPL